MMKRTLKRTLAVLLVLCSVLTGTCGCGARQETIVFSEHLDDTVLTLDGTDYPLRALAFYIAYEEQTIQQQALLYDEKDPEKYWNTHMNGHFTRVRARQEAMNLAIHDFIFYAEATELELSLEQDEIDYATQCSEDFWMDLGEYGQQALGITKEELTEDILRMALAQKYEELYAAMEDVEPEDCQLGGMVYEEIIKEHTYKIRNRVWEGISMGRVTLEQKKEQK